MTLADEIRALKSARDWAGSHGWSDALDRAAALADKHKATQLSNDERLEYQMALIWCSAAADFAPEGQAREGWLKLCKPLIDRQPIEGASRDNWNAWLDDLPMPDEFEEGIAALQRFIAGLPADQHQADADALVAAAYEAVAVWLVRAGLAGDAADDPLATCIRAMTGADARAALDRMLAEARKEGMREAAAMATSFLVGHPGEGVPMRSPTPHEIKRRILAAAEKEAGN